MKNLKEYIVEGIFDIEDNIDNVDESVKYQIKQFLKDNFYEASSCKISNKPNKDGKYEVSCNESLSVKNKKITSLTNKSFIWTNVDGDLTCVGCHLLTSLQGAPKEVGSFNCYNCDSLTSLQGAPKEVSRHFDCSGCKSLTSLEGAPEKVGLSFDCDDCKLLISLQGAPKEVGKNFYCMHCHSLTSLEGAPKKVGGDFYCGDCHSLTSLEGAPKKVGGDFDCGDCYLKFTKEYVKKVSNVKGNIYI